MRKVHKFKRLERKSPLSRFKNPPVMGVEVLLKFDAAKYQGHKVQNKVPAFETKLDFKKFKSNELH